MAQIPNWLLGRHLTAVTVTPITASSDGTLSTVSGASLSGYIQAVNFRSNPALEMIQSVDRTIANYEGLYNDFSVELVEILAQKSDAWSPVLPAVASQYDLAIFSFTRGGQSYTMQGRIGPFEDGVQSFGKNTCSLQIVPIDIGGDTGNPVTVSL